MILVGMPAVSLSQPGFPEAVQLNRNLAASIEYLIHIFCWHVRPRQALLRNTVILLAPWKQSGANVTPAHSKHHFESICFFDYQDDMRQLSLLYSQGDQPA